MLRKYTELTTTHAQCMVYCIQYYDCIIKSWYIYSDHSSLSAVISVVQAVPNLCVSRKVFLKHRVNWNTVCGAVHDLPWRNIWSTNNPVEVLNEHMLLLVGRLVPTKIIRV